MRYASTISFWLATFLLALTTSALATPIVVSGAFNIRDDRSANDVNITPGDRILFGASSVVPSAATTGFATQGTTTRTLNFDGSSIAPNQFDTSIAHNASRTGSWTLTFNNGPDQTVVSTPTIGSTTPAIPFVTNMSISGSGLTPTFSWTSPSTALFDRVQVEIWDVENRVGSSGIGNAGVANRVFRANLPDTATSYTLQTAANGGFDLVEGHVLRSFDPASEPPGC